MGDQNEILNIVDDTDHVIGQATRRNIHLNGLLHREVAVWVYNDTGELLLQRRAPDKDIAPNLLDTSAGGHVGIGDTYVQAAVKELKEETNIEASVKDLALITKNERKSGQQLDGKINNAIRLVFVYHFNREKDDLRMEEGKITSLEWWPMEKLLNLSDTEKKEFSSFVIKDLPEVHRAVSKLLSNQVLSAEV